MLAWVATLRAAWDHLVASRLLGVQVGQRGGWRHRLAVICLENVEVSRIAVVPQKPVDAHAQADCPGHFNPFSV